MENLLYGKAGRVCRVIEMVLNRDFAVCLSDRKVGRYC